MENLTRNERNKGITLIALVITIIILLILAAISIATLTGENGLLAKSAKAKEDMERAEAEEQVRIAVMASYDEDGNINMDELNDNLRKIPDLTYKGAPIDEKEKQGGNRIETLPADVEVNGYTVHIDEYGNVTVKDDENSDEEETEPSKGNVRATVSVTSEPENGETYVLGETITYEVTITNEEETELTDIVVLDKLTGDKWTIDSLPLNEPKTYTAAYVVTEKDILAGSVENVITGKNVTVESNTEVSLVEPKNGHVTIGVTTTSTPENGETYALEEKITFEVTITNDGNLTITDLTITDELTEGSWTIRKLEPGASETYTTSYMVTEADILAGSVINMATATGTSPDPDEPEVPVESWDCENPTDPKNGHATITMTTTNTPKNGTAYTLGETITYSITVTNDGNLTFTYLTVTDELTGDRWTIDSLAPGESKTYTTSHVVNEADIASGSVINVATATGTSTDEPVEPGEVEVPVQ